MALDYDPYPGMRVTCVEDDFFGYASPLCRHEIYTIADVRWDDDPGETPWGPADDGLLIVFLSEVRNPYCFLPPYDGFDARRFRPLDEKQLEQFRALLETAPAELEDAQ